MTETGPRSITVPQLDATARRLLGEVVDTFEKLEVIVQLHAATGPRTLDDIVQRTPFARDLVRDALAALVRATIVRGDGPGGWTLASDGEWADGIAALLHAYTEDRLLVLDAMTQFALQRIRGEAAQIFADAFLIRPKKGKPDG